MKASGGGAGAIIWSVHASHSPSRLSAAFSMVSAHQALGVVALYLAFKQLARLYPSISYNRWKEEERMRERGEERLTKWPPPPTGPRGDSLPPRTPGPHQLDESVGNLLLLLGGGLFQLLFARLFHVLLLNGGL